MLSHSNKSTTIHLASNEVSLLMFDGVVVVGGGAPLLLAQRHWKTTSILILLLCKRYTTLYTVCWVDEKYYLISSTSTTSTTTRCSARPTKWEMGKCERNWQLNLFEFGLTEKNFTSAQSIIDANIKQHTTETNRLECLIIMSDLNANTFDVRWKRELVSW